MRRLAGLLLLVAAPAAAAPGAWEVRDADTRITLFGTIHALPKEEAWLVPALAARLDAADTLVIEAIIPEDKYALAPVVAEIGLKDGLKPLAQRVPAEAGGRLAAAMLATGLPTAALDRMKTWLAAITLGEAGLRAMGITSDSGVEPALEARARAARKSVVGLETPEQQLRYFDALPEADQVAMLEATLADLAVAKVDTERLIAYWRAGDIDAIAREFDKEAKASPLLKTVLLTSRNRRWADWVAGVMKRPGKIFMAVGAGHLGGPEGLLALLRARGLAVTPVDLAVQPKAVAAPPLPGGAARR